MNILFLTLSEFKSIEEKGIYSDLMRELVKTGHKVYSISPVERRKNEKTCLIKEAGSVILRLQIGNTQKTNIIEKGISTVMIEPQYKAAIKKYFSDVKFDLVLYSTPPITLVSAIEYVKKRDGAKSYLLLKDIFPQNAADIGMMTTTGVKGMLYRRFRAKEKRLYAISDRIGCMSPANVEYVIKHNPEVNPAIVEVCPNSVEPEDRSVSPEAAREIRRKYGIPEDKRVFVYGGNLGKPQGIPFLIECLRRCASSDDAYFLIVGSGTEYGMLEEYAKEAEAEAARMGKHCNFRLMKFLPKEDYDAMVGACDVGMIFLDHRFTIPNFPSRLLSYTQAKLPVLAVTDPNTDIGKVVIDGGFGWWCESNDSEAFAGLVHEALQLHESELTAMGERGFSYMAEHYDIADAARTVLATFGKE